MRRFFRSLARQTAALMPILSIQPSGHISANYTPCQQEIQNCPGKFASKEIEHYIIDEVAEKSPQQQLKVTRQ